MRKRLVIGVVLALLLVGVLIVSVHLQETERQTMQTYQTQLAHLEQRAAELEAKEQKLEKLAAEAERRTEEMDSITARAEELKAEKAALLAETEQLLAEFDTVRQQLKDGDSDQSYYLEVYDALTEGINKVKGYIAGN